MYTKVAFQKSQKNPTTKDIIINSSIQWWTKSKFFHVAVLLDGYWYTALPLGGVQKLKEIDLEEFEIIEIKHRKLHPEQHDIMLDYLNDQIGIEYDWRGILFSQVFKFGINSSSKWFCSEFVVKILQLMYVKEVFDELPNKVSPARLYWLLTGTKK
jgi:hypothetical protein